jgi:hypothetical protein
MYNPKISTEKTKVGKFPVKTETLIHHYTLREDKSIQLSGKYVHQANT